MTAFAVVTDGVVTNIVLGHPEAGFPDGVELKDGDEVVVGDFRSQSSFSSVRSQLQRHRGGPILVRRTHDP